MKSHWQQLGQILRLGQISRLGQILQLGQISRLAPSWWTQRQF